MGNIETLPDSAAPTACIVLCGGTTPYTFCYGGLDQLTTLRAPPAAQSASDRNGTVDAITLRYPAACNNRSGAA